MRLERREQGKPVMRCGECGREDVGIGFDKARKVKRPKFHYAPCGNPCGGGPISDEEMTYHRRVHVEGCKETAA